MEKREGRRWDVLAAFHARSTSSVSLQLAMLMEILGNWDIQ